MKMRSALVLALAAVALCVAGCTAVQEVGDDVTTKFDQGITGQGRLISPDQVSDSFGSEYN
jgi:predicted small secreted protein